MFRPQQAATAEAQFPFPGEGVAGGRGRGAKVVLCPYSTHLTYFLISANTPFNLWRVPQGRAEVMPVKEKCGCAASGSAFC